MKNRFPISDYLRYVATSLLSLAAGCTAGALVIAVIIIVGCATLRPGADPLVVRAEQVESGSLATFDLVLGVDNADRGFWHSNAPAFHSFCSWLRAPQQVSSNTLPRSLALIWNVNAVKTDYKASRASSNALYEVVMTLQSAVTQASAWLTITTNTPPH